MARSGSGIAIFDTAGIDIENLAIAGTAKAFRNGDGIVLYSDLSRNRKLDHIVITRVDISGFSNGISMGGGKGSTGFRDVTISYSQLHANLDAGLTTYGPVFDARSPAYVNENVSVSHVQAFRNRGDRSFTAHNTGSGIALGSVRDGIISWSTAYATAGTRARTRVPTGSGPTTPRTSRSSTIWRTRTTPTTRPTGTASAWTRTRPIPSCSTTCPTATTAPATCFTRA